MNSFGISLYSKLKSLNLLDCRTKEELNSKLCPQWKIDRDFFYSEIYNNFISCGVSKEEALSYIKEAGFFFDESVVDYSITFGVGHTPMTNFLENIPKSLKKKRKLAVLLSSGSFCPIHSGHIDSLKLAKIAVEKKGYEVLGGYISPAHDNYIFRKNPDKALNIHKRIKLIRNYIVNDKWLDVYDWEGLHNSVDINFTDVITRLSIYLKSYIDKDIELFFVCGGDNANFSLTFERRGHCVVVNRPCYELKFNQYKEICCKNKRIIWVEDNNNDASSTKLRNFTITPEIREILRNAYNQGRLDTHYNFDAYLRSIE